MAMLHSLCTWKCPWQCPVRRLCIVCWVLSRWSESLSHLFGIPGDIRSPPQCCSQGCREFLLHCHVCSGLLVAFFIIWWAARGPPGLWEVPRPLLGLLSAPPDSPGMSGVKGCTSGSSAGRWGFYRARGCLQTARKLPWTSQHVVWPLWWTARPFVCVWVCPEAFLHAPRPCVHLAARHQVLHLAFSYPTVPGGFWHAPGSSCFPFCMPQGVLCLHCHPLVFFFLSLHPRALLGALLGLARGGGRRGVGGRGRE